MRRIEVTEDKRYPILTLMYIIFTIGNGLVDKNLIENYPLPIIDHVKPTIL